ncbi:MAG: hypothetical protein M3Q99_11555 [Acidobacteriota bacterium]|nr:hypothetical protein [Acidobacteriota bacterium]
MKNISTILTVLLVILSVGLGCGISEHIQKEVTGNSNAVNADNKTVVDNAVDTAVSGEKIGVQECDELYDYVGDLVTKGENENFATKAARQYFLNRIREQVKTSIEQNKNDKVQMAKDCKDYRRQIDAFINQPPDNSK